MRENNQGRATRLDLVASILAAWRCALIIAGGNAMQWIGETIESPATGSLDTDLEQGSTRSSSGATSFGYNLLDGFQAKRGGGFSVRMKGDHDGLPRKVAEALDAIVAATHGI